MPLLIGGATTSRQHTAVKIAPEYDEPSRTCSTPRAPWRTVASLLDPKQKDAFVVETREDQEQLRRLHAHKRDKPVVALATANEHRPAVAFGPRHGRGAAHARACSRSRASRSTRSSPYIDWTFFFTAWELAGKFPARARRSAARRRGARALRARQGAARPHRAREEARRAARPTGSGLRRATGNDIVLYEDDARTRERTRFCMLRQQQAKPQGEPYRCLADFVAPHGSGVAD